MSVVVSYPGNFQDAQQAARAFYERGELAAFVTALAIDENNIVKRLSDACLPARLNQSLAREFSRRAIKEIPADRVVSYPWLDGLRTLLSRYSRNPVFADLAWDAMARSFDKTVARRHLRGAQLVYAFEYTALHTLERAKAEGIASILGMPSLDSKEFENIQKREEAQFPELVTRHHEYFARRFPVRYERRKAEIALADLIIANSELTRQSHIRAGADPNKIIAVPLAAPPPIDAVDPTRHPANDSLSVVWAGNFSIGKGAHHFLDAWRRLNAGCRARAVVYGRNALPERVLRPLPNGLELSGFVPQKDLFAAFACADILVFPTLADGFGSVVLEAFSRGLPVITTRSAGASEFIEHESNGLLIPPADAVALVDALQWCLDNRDTLFHMRFAALETARRWQWADYRRLLLTKVGDRLTSTGYAFDFDREHGLFGALD